MAAENPKPEPSSERSRIVLASTFTVAPLVESLSFLTTEAGLNLDVVLAPYNQIYQELFDPSRQFAQNRAGVNVVLLRFEDWWRDQGGAAADPLVATAAGERNCDDLITALRTFAETSTSAIVVVLCPPSPSALVRPEIVGLLKGLAARLVSGIGGLPNLTVLDDEAFGIFDPVSAYDAGGDRLGHLPYTPVFFAALAQNVARVVHTLKTPPYKVLMLDCDNTLWKGVVGEDGVDGIELTEPYLALQRFVVAKKNAGMLICLVSKNVEADVVEVFRRRPDMVLKLEDIVSMRVNWLPKSQNLQDLARELNLGLDSFVFIDDSPVECAEVESSCPGVLALRLPIEGDFPRFLSQVWPLDSRAVTEADRRRTEMYQENRARERHQRSASNLAEFIAGLDVRIEVAAPSPDQWPRVAQLTQRTNQFNFTTRRRSEGELRGLVAEGGRCLAVQVRDRFGDYGLVGAVIFAAGDGALTIDTFLLSCRVLGRGVEHAIVRHLGALARTMDLTRIVAPFIPTAKNVPARRFLESLGSEADPASGPEQFVISAEKACGVFPAADSVPEETPPEESSSTSRPPSSDPDKSARWNRLARELADPAQILSAMGRKRVRDRPLSSELVLPRSSSERQLMGIWREVLNIREIGIRDDYFEIGGTSLEAVMICVAIEQRFGKRLPLTVFIEDPTVEALAVRLDRREETQSLVALQRSGTGTPLFLVHDADGETLLYRNLALRLAGRRPVYAIQPQGREDTPIVHTRIEQMATHYVREIRKVQPRGPYLLGGLCAAGVLSFEMALQLEQVGEEAQLVAVFDAADVEARPRQMLEASRRLGRLREAVRGGALTELPGIFAGKARNYVAYQLGRRVRGAVDRFSVATLRLCLERGLPLPPWARDLSVRAVYTVAEALYRPEKVTRHRIVLFRATVGQGSDEPYVQLFEDPLLGWQKRTAGGVMAIDVPGGHSSMLQEPNVAAIADELERYLDAGDREDADDAARSAAAGSSANAPAPPA
jgi:FkbH-like protein